MNVKTILRGGRTLAAACFALACVSNAAVAQEKYPVRPVEVIVPWGPGGGSDTTGRMVARFLETELKASFPVVNVPGASGVTGVQKMLLAPADGYSMAVSGDYYALIAAPNAKWTLDDFIPVAMAINQPGAIFVAENSRFKTWADVEKEARAKPDTIKIVIAGYGIIDEIHINILRAKGTKLLVVPFPKPSERYVSILGGHAELMYEQAGDVKSYLTNKQIRPLLSFTAKRFPAFPDVPTAREMGYDAVTPQVRWVFMKAGTDPQRVKTLSDALTKMSKTPEYRNYLEDQIAAPDSYVPASEARQYLQNLLVGVRKESATAGMKMKQ
ncbi:MAG: tripartite tricarboxylate transporter substrate binding protein [Giesbergeria sp.]